MHVKKLLPLLFFLFTTKVFAATYYLASTGDDNCNDGLTPSTAWRTISGRVNTHTFMPGDQVLFKAGEVFTGSINISSADSGTALAPVIFDSFGTGRASISSGGARGFFGNNVSGITVRNLIFYGTASTTGIDGVSVYSDAVGGNHDIIFDNLDISGYGGSGVRVGGWQQGTTQVPGSGYHTVSIKNSLIHNNKIDGINVYARFRYANSDITIDNVKTYNNTGYAGSGNASGSGIVLGGTTNGLIQNSEAYNNGTLNNNSAGGPVGIWTYDSTNVTIQNNNSHNNHSTVKDGGGFDFDQNVSNSILQNNTSANNDGAGYLVAHGPATLEWHDNQIINNTSTNDAQLREGGIHIYGAPRNLTINANTIIKSSGSSPLGAVTADFLSSSGQCMDTVNFSGNIFNVTGPDLINIAAAPLACATNLHFLGNGYTGSPFAIVWGATTYTSCTAWHNATGQENCTTPPPPAPTVTSATPNVGTQGQTLSVALAGTGFLSGATCDFGAGITINSCTFNSSTQLTASIAITTGAGTGGRTVTVVNPDLQSGFAANAFTVTAAPLPPPTVTSATPNSAAQGATLDVVLAGGDFQSGATCSFGSGITVNSCTFDSVTQLTANISIAGGAAVGSYTITVTNPDSQSDALVSGFVVTAAPPPAPTVSSATPNTGAQGATLGVVIAGTGFLASPTCSFGAGVTINSCVRDSSIQITSNITIAGGAATGGRTVTVTNTDSQSGSLANGFTITGAPPPAPTVSSVSPNSGAQGQSFSIAITGTGFQSGATSSFGSGITINSTTFNSATNLTASITIAAGATLGTRTVTVTNPDAQNGTLPSGFTVTAPVLPPPTVTSLSPNSGTQGTTLSSVITGSNFVNGATCNFGSGITVNSCTFSSATSLTASIAIAAGAASGARTVTVMNPDGQSGSKTGGFTVLTPPPPAPTVSTVTPNTGVQGTTLTSVVIAGTGFQSGATSSFGSGITVNSTTFNSSTQLTANITIAGGATVGTRTVTVTNPDAQFGSAAAAFSVTASPPPPAPTVTSVSPNSGNRSQTIASDVITGTGFVAGLTCSYGAGITVNSCTRNSATQATANITIAAGAASGGRTVTVTNPDAQSGSLANAFTVIVPPPAPTVTAISPTSGAQGATLTNVIVTGTGFQSGAVTSFSGAGITVNSTTFNSATQLTVNLTIAGGAATTARNVVVTNPDVQAGTLTNGFTVTAFVAAAPTVTSTNPNTGPQGQTITTVITGTGFQSGATCSFGSGITVNSCTFGSATGLTASVTIAVGAAIGARTVTVTNPDAQSGSLSSGFTVTSAPVDVTTWTDNSSDETSFIIERSDDGAAYAQVGSVNANVTSFTDTGIPTTVQFCHRVKARNANGDSGYAGGSGSACAGPISSAPAILTIGANEGVGTTALDSTGGFNGTWNGAWIAHPSYGSSLSFTAPTNVLTISGLTTHSTKRTWALWTYRIGNGGGGLGRIFTKGSTDMEDLYYDSVHGTYRFLRLWSGSAAGWTILAPSANAWHHIAVAYDASSVNAPSMWIDGVAQTVTQDTAAVGTASTNTQPYRFGNRGDLARQWDGRVDEIQIFNRKLTTAEVNTVMTTPLP